MDLEMDLSKKVSTLGLKICRLLTANCLMESNC